MGKHIRIDDDINQESHNFIIPIKPGHSSEESSEYSHMALSINDLNFIINQLWESGVISINFFSKGRVKEQK